MRESFELEEKPTETLASWYIIAFERIAGRHVAIHWHLFDSFNLVFARFDDGQHTFFPNTC